MQGRGKEFYDDVSKNIKSVVDTAEEATNSFIQGFQETTHLLLRAISNTTQPPIRNAAPKPAASVNSVINDEESKNTKKKPRKTRDYSANVTASLSLKDEKFKTKKDPSAYDKISSYFTGKKIKKYIDDDIDICNDMALLEKQFTEEVAKKDQTDPDIIQRLQLRKVELVKEQIIEHAARRADMFFYLCIALYGTNVRVTKINRAEKQHGIGCEERGTAACHSSLFPNIKLEDSEALSSILNDSYLEEDLNATVELPTIVNDFDGHLEGRFQPTTFVDDCVTILNSVATKKKEGDSYNPMMAMNDFYKIMNEHFICFSRKHLRRNTKIKNHLAHEKIWEYQREGTFSGADDKTLDISSDYLKMMLRMNSYLDLHTYEYYIRLIQKEILSAKSNDLRSPHARPKLG